MWRGRAAWRPGRRPLRASGRLVAPLARATFLTALLLAPPMLAQGCGGGGHEGSEGAASTSREATVPVTDSLARAVLARHTDSLMAVPGVVGTALGLCKGEYCIKVLVEKPTPVIRRRVPERLEGIRVEVVPTGRIRAVGEDTGDTS